MWSQLLALEQVGGYDHSKEGDRLARLKSYPREPKSPIPEGAQEIASSMPWPPPPPAKPGADGRPTVTTSERLFTRSGFLAYLAGDEVPEEQRPNLVTIDELVALQRAPK